MADIRNLTTAASIIPSVQTVNQKPQNEHEPQLQQEHHQQQQQQQQKQQQQQLQHQQQHQLQHQQPHQQQQQLQLQQQNLSVNPRPRKSRPCCYTCCCCCCDSGDEGRKRTASSRTVSGHSSRFSSDDASHIASIHSGRRSVSRGKQCCKKFLTFLFSQIGMCALVVCYAILGGFLFRWLESTNEVTQRENVQDARERSVSLLWNITEELNILYEQNWTKMADDILHRFQEHVYQAVKDGSWDGQDVEADVRWSFAGSLLYSITVISTIGYGHITPKTDWGKLATIFYALVGIPLTLLCLSNIGTAFAHCFRFLYYHICRCLSCVGCSPPATYSTPKTHAKNDRRAGKRQVATPNKGKVLAAPGTGAAATSTGILADRGNEGVSGKLEDPEDPTDRVLVSQQQAAARKGKTGENSNQRNRNAGTHNHHHHHHHNHHRRKQKERINTADVRVPVTICLLIMALYIFGGAVLFSLWEKEWTYLIGAYFCFITLSTIGFGDYVFGVGSDFATNEKTIICAVYLVLGLSIIAMCFNLMQEEVRAKSRWLGTKLGIIDEEHRRS